MSELVSYLEDCLKGYKQASIDENEGLLFLLQFCGPLFSDSNSGIYSDDGVDHFIEVSNYVSKITYSL